MWLELLLPNYRQSIRSVGLTLTESATWAALSHFSLALSWAAMFLVGRILLSVVRGKAVDAGMARRAGWWQTSNRTFGDSAFG